MVRFHLTHKIDLSILPPTNGNVLTPHLNLPMHLRIKSNILALHLLCYFASVALSFSAMAGQPGKTGAGATNNGYSNYFPRYSSNGRWMVFTQSPTGLVLQPEARLCIVPVNYTELYLTHIDDQGKSSPAVRLFCFSSNKLAAMVPEFVTLSAPLPEYLNLESSEQAKGANMAIDGREIPAAMLGKLDNNN